MERLMVILNLQDLSAAGGYPGNRFHSDKKRGLGRAGCQLDNQNEGRDYGREVVPNNGLPMR